MKKLIRNLMLALLLLNVSIARAKDDKTKVGELMAKDSADINALASYPDSTRRYIFEVSTESKGLEKLSDVQKQTNEDFKKAIASYSKDDQQKIWNLTRYDNLISQLVTGGQKTNEQVEEILKNYPADVHDDALNFGVNHYDLLVKINDENVKFGESYNDITKDYPTETQTAYNELMKFPEIISIMSQNISMTSDLGDLYKDNPVLIKQEFDSLNLQLARQKAQDTQAWEDSLKNNPQAMSELQASAKEYAKADGYAGSDYSTDPQVVVNYHPRPYPYWAGYPSWYGVDYWYPNPYWYDAGFYYYGGSVVFTGVPTYHFTYWGFNHYPHYFYTYPHLSNLYFNRYYGARGAIVYNTNSRYTARIINQWSARNQRSLPNGFMANDPDRVDRIRELGKVEMDRRQYNRQNPSARVGREEYINRNSVNYPHIQPAVRNDVRESQSASPGYSPNRKVRQPSQQTPSYQAPVRSNEQRSIENIRQAPAVRQQQSQQPRQQSQQPRQIQSQPRQIQQQPRQQIQPRQQQERAAPPQRTEGSPRQEGERRR